MDIGRKKNLLLIDDILIYGFLLSQVVSIFFLDYRINFFDAPGVLYLEGKSNFPVATFNSINFTLCFGFTFFIINVIPYFNMVFDYIKNGDLSFFDALKRSHRLLNWAGYVHLNPARIVGNVKKITFKFKVFLLLFIFYMVFMFFYWFLGWAVPDIPAHAVLVSLISLYKVVLLVFNMLLFSALSFFLLSCCINVVLIFYSFFVKVSFF